MEKKCQNCKFGLAEGKGRGEKIECVIHHPSLLVSGCDRWKAKEEKPGVSFTCDTGQGKTKDFHIDLSEKGEGTKYDTGKPRIGEMIKDFGIPLLEVCRVWEFGTVKYSKSNWKKVDGGEDRYTNAMIRHFLAEDEEGIDAETEIEHYAHLAWNALSRIKFIMENKKNGN